jgi:hypothetical protein
VEAIRTPTCTCFFGSPMNRKQAKAFGGPYDNQTTAGLTPVPRGQAAPGSSPSWETRQLSPISPSPRRASAAKSVNGAAKSRRGAAGPGSSWQPGRASRPTSDRSR